MNELTTLWTMVLITFNPTPADSVTGSLVTKSFGDFVTESRCYAAIDFIDRTSFFSPESAGGWVLTCDPPWRNREYAR